MKCQLHFAKWILPTPAAGILQAATACAGPSYAVSQCRLVLLTRHRLQ